MSDTNLRTNSTIELSDIRKLDILLTQCESSSCENICIDCCAKLGSVEDDDDDENADDGNNSGSDSLIGGSGAAANEPPHNSKLLRQQRIVDTKATRSTDRNDVISNVPAIISTNASPDSLCIWKNANVSKRDGSFSVSLDVNPPVATPTTMQTVAADGGAVTAQHSGMLPSLSGGEQLNFEHETKMFQSSDVRHNLQHQQPNQYLHAASDELTYCRNCGGITTFDKQNLAKKQYSSLDKERNERASNFLQCSSMNRYQGSNGASENALLNSRKQCSFDGGTSEKSFGKTSLSGGTTAPGGSNSKRTLLSTKQACDKCGKNVKSPPSKKSSSHRSECGTSLSNRSLRDKSNKSSQNSLKEARSSRMNSIFYLGSERENSQKSKRASYSYSRKASTRGGLGLNLHEEQDAETREILLGGTTSSTSKFPHDIKIPEPVEAVCLFTVINECY